MISSLHNIQSHKADYCPVHQSSILNPQSFFATSTSTLPKASELVFQGATLTIYSSASRSWIWKLLLLDPEAQGQFQYTVQIFLLSSYRSRLPSVPEKASSRPHELMSTVASGAITIELITLADNYSSLSPFLWDLPLQWLRFGGC